MDLWELSDLATPWCVHVAATLRVADRLTGGPMSSAQLGAACGADASALSRVLRHLVQKGVFDEPQPEWFELNDTARQFLDEGKRLGLDLEGFGGRMAYAWETLLPAVRTGRCAYADRFGRSFWEDLDAHTEIGAQFDEVLGPTGHGTPDPEVLVDPAGWASVRTVVDVGGGTGALLAEILKAHPEARGTLVDLPRPAASSARLFEAAGVADRASAVAQSFFDPLPAGADLYVVKGVLNDWPDAEAVAILKRCAEAMRPDSRLVVSGGVGEGDRAAPELLMLVLVGGRVRTVPEFTEMARSAGLRVRATGRQPSGRFLVECSR